MHPTSRISRAAAAFVLAASTAAGALAVPVTPGGGSVALPGTTAAANPVLAGSIIADVVTHWVSAIDPLYGFPGAEGSLQSRVVRETSTGTLDFYWRVTVDGPSYPTFVPTGLALSSLPLANFLTGTSYDADYRLDGTGNSAPAGASAADASSFTWQFDSSLGPGGSTYFLLLHSNATAYDDSAFAAVGVSTFGTFAPVPETSDAGLLLAGLLACGALWKRQRRGTVD
jgi:hypothetical protein